MSYYNRYKPYAPFIRSMKYYYRPVSKESTFKNSLDQFYFQKPLVDKKLTEEFYADQTDKLADDDKFFDEVESMRPSTERDFYQDHSYNNQWLSRQLDDEQKAEVASRYPFFAPNFKVSPWLWYPGDLVEVVEGPFAGQRGQILSVFAYKNECTVQNVNVQKVEIPSSEDRPSQELDREHPIHVNMVRHVDPKTNKPTELRILSVKGADGKPERRRVTLESGSIMPIPKENEDMGSDPLLETPLMDAEEQTYDEASELGSLVERKLQAMEKGFVKRLKTSYDYHRRFQLQNEQSMRQYQRDVVDRAEEMILEKL